METVSRKSDNAFYIKNGRVPWIAENDNISASRRYEVINQLVNYEIIKIFKRRMHRIAVNYEREITNVRIGMTTRTIRSANVKGLSANPSKCQTCEHCTRAFVTCKHSRSLVSKMIALGPLAKSYHFCSTTRSYDTIEA